MRLAPPLLAAALALSTTGCADDGAGPGPTAAQSADTGTAFDPQEFTGRLEAAVERSPTVRIGMELTVDGRVSASAQGTQDLAENSLDMDVTTGPRELGYRLVDGDYYLAQPPKWVPVEPDSQSPTIQQIQLLSMRNLLDAFVAGLEAAGVKGREDIGGIATTHYTANVDSTKALTQLGTDVAPGTPESIRFDVWVDEDDLIRKLAFTQNGTTTTMTGTDWGKPVTIEKPRPSQLTRVPSAGTP